MQYGNKYGHGVKPVSTAKAAKANVMESRLNKGGHQAYRGTRTGVKHVKGNCGGTYNGEGSKSGHASY